MNSKLEILKQLKNEIQIKIEGETNFPTDNPTIVIANHNCLKDIFYLPTAIPTEIVSLISSRLIYKQDLQRQKIVNKYLYSMPIEAHGGKIYSDLCLEFATKLLNNGINLNIFPEGAYINDTVNVYKGRTGAARILYTAKDNGIQAYIVPIAIEVKQQDSDLDNYNLLKSDQVNIKILKPINYDEYYYIYKNCDDRTTKNDTFHIVIDKGMQSIASALNRNYVDSYIELFNKGNVIFANGEQLDVSSATKSQHVNRYSTELNNRILSLKKQLKLQKNI